jgi:hypothetical protein
VVIARRIGEGKKHDVRAVMGTQSNDLPMLRKKVGGEQGLSVQCRKPFAKPGRREKMLI